MCDKEAWQVHCRNRRVGMKVKEGGNMRAVSLGI